MDYDLNRLSEEERDHLFTLLDKATPVEVSQETSTEVRPIAGAQEDVPVPTGGGPGHLPPQGERAFGEAPKPNPPQVQRLPTAEQWVGKQIRNLEAVGEQNYRDGITRPKRDPIQAGIAGQGAYETKMRDPEVLRRRADQLRKTNMDEWAALAESIGAPNLVRGVTARRFKVERFVGAYQPKLEQHLRTVDSLPNITDADRERRMVENLRGLKKLKGQA